MFVNEDNVRRLLEAYKLTRSEREGRELTFLASDSWGAKTHPVSNNEEAAEGTVTILPERNQLDGKYSLFIIHNGL